MRYHLLAVLGLATVHPAHAFALPDALAAEAKASHGEPGARAAAFLDRYSPPRDESIDPALLASNLELALKARETFPWARDVSEAMFFNDVLPYAVLDETREPWRAMMYERCARIVKDATTAEEAIQALNRELFKEINVHYNTGRKAPNQNLSESIAQGRATCTGLSIILVQACRTVGIPARIAGVPNWADKRGNHTWVEVWDGERWRFTGADEYNAKGLDRAWFVNDARRATPGSEEHAVWATSWRATGDHFPMVWNRADRGVPAVDVTARYAADAAVGASAWDLRLWTTKDGQRRSARITVTDADGKPVGTVTTRGESADLNDMPRITTRAGKAYTLRIEMDGVVRTTTLESKAQIETLDLYWDELAMSEADAEATVLKLFAERQMALTEAANEVFAEQMVRVGAHEMRLLERAFGEVPEGERSLWISMHGGGGAPAAVNDQQWQNQIRLYEPNEGFYVAPRAPTDTWNLWHQGHIDGLFDRLIDAYVATRGVDPNRVYLMGYSAGGDGVYQLGPRFGDRLAAAAMMAGHPNETKPDGLRNLPFMIFMGGEDSAYKRNTVARSWGEQLGALRDADPDGYAHKVTIYDGLGHWMNGRDREALPWMAEQVRTVWPERVVWLQDDAVRSRFAWLAVDEPKARARIEAIVDGQTIELITEDVDAVTLRLRDALIDLDQPIVVQANGVEVFRGTVPRTEQAVLASLAERLDGSAAATATLRLAW